MCFWDKNKSRSSSTKFVLFTKQTVIIYDLESKSFDIWFGAFWRVDGRGLVRWYTRGALVWKERVKGVHYHERSLLASKFAEVICKQSLWNHVWQMLHALDLPQRTAIENSPHGYLGLLGTGLLSICLLRSRPIRTTYWLWCWEVLRPYCECQ